MLIGLRTPVGELLAVTEGALLGEADGDELGDSDLVSDGALLPVIVGEEEGSELGSLLGLDDGNKLGSLLGSDDGAADGLGPSSVGAELVVGFTDGL